MRRGRAEFFDFEEVSAWSWESASSSSFICSPTIASEENFLFLEVPLVCELVIEREELAEATVFGSLRIVDLAEACLLPVAGVLFGRETERLALAGVPEKLKPNDTSPKSRALLCVSSLWLQAILNLTQRLVVASNGVVVDLKKHCQHNVHFKAKFWVLYHLDPLRNVMAVILTVARRRADALLEKRVEGTISQC